MADGLAESSCPVAALDCGTNSTRLLVVGADGEALDRQMHVTRLGEGVDATGVLDPTAIDRTVKVLRRYRRRMDELGVVRARLVATSAARDAINAAEFFDAAQAATALKPELLSGEEEGRLSFAGATAHLPSDLARSRLLVVDIGGGSTELVVGSAELPSEARTVSLDIGCVRVTERFFAHDPPTAEELATAQTSVLGELRRAKDALPSLEPGGWVVGLAGTVSTLAALECGLTEYSRQNVHHAVLGASDVERWLVALGSEPGPKRLARPGMVEGRADVIVGGVVVLHQVMEVFDRARCLVSEDDILDGLAASIR